MIHRYIAAILGFLILTLAVLAYRKKDEINVKPSLVYGLLGLVIAQGMLGMWTVTELLMPIIVSLHLLGGMTTLGLLTYIAHRHWGTVSDKLISLNPTSIKIIRFSFVILFIQIFLGGWTSTNYAALACTDFPTCHGELIPPMDFSNGFSLWRELGVTSEGEALTLQALQAIQWVHRVGAFIFVSYFLYVIYLMSKFKSCNLYRNLLIIVIGFQFVIGVLNLLLHLPLALATMHNLGAALLVIITVIINSRITPKYD
jgi:cytochrome c oxidase assembly protein subunit 15